MGYKYSVPRAERKPGGRALRGRSLLEGTLRRGDTALGRVRFELDLLSSLGQFWGSVRPTPPAQAR